jgi:hypothetical protein
VAAHRLQPVEGAGEVHVDHVLPVLARHLLDHRRADDAGVVHQARHGAEATHGLLDGAGCEVRIGDAADHRHHPVRWQQRGRFGQRLRVHVQDHGVAAQLHHQLGRGAADALAGAGDDDGAAFQRDDVFHAGTP